MEEVTLEENTEEDSCLDMLATQNAEQFTPQMLAITKAQDEQQIAEDATMSVMENLMPQFLESFADWQSLMDRAEQDKNADMQEILRSIKSSFGPLKDLIKKMEQTTDVAFKKAENVEILLAEKDELPKPAQKISKPRGGNNRRK
ncbi:unnamed protein product [Oikopleura dioica]|uniref:Uncharacterized protein n=1 Tax=Oikopleura dioica TaxID=34765 RepID=E4WXJ4_OIKDI|nr:unnamed protein product [Oikopleura dioica]CBY39241.1 unnamed protein product [Oikopleura dioica]